MTEDTLPIEQIYSHPVVQQLLERIKDNGKLDLENIKIPFVMKDKILMSPGVWNNYYYSPKSISEAFMKTRWDSKEIRSLYADHEDRRSREWIGEVTNARMQGDDLIGDLVIVDKSTAQKLAYGAKMGISPKVHGVEDSSEMVNFEFDNFSVVINPAVKTAYINNMQVETDIEGSNKDIKKMEEAKNMAETPKVEEKPLEQKEEILQTVAAPAEPVAPQVPVATPEPVAVAMSDTDQLIQALAEVEVDNQGLQDLLKKAKEIRKEGEAWKDAIARAKKEMSETMAETNAFDQIMKLAQMLKEKKYPVPEKGAVEEKKYPYPEEPKKDAVPPEEMACKKKMEESKVQEMETTIKQLSEQLDSVTAKLNEPDKKAVKTAELAASTEEDMVRGNPDHAVLSVFKRMGGN
jgi:hypothetical protein